MLTFRNTSLATLIAAAILVPASFFFLPALWLLALILAAYLAVLVYGSVFVCSGFYIQAVCRGDTEEKAVALTFDDGPDERITPMVLDKLNEEGIKAAFFCMGHRAAYLPGTVRRIVAEGHMVGNHSDTHGYLFDLKPYRRMKEDLRQAENIITGITGLRTRWMRPPYGVTNPALARAARKLHYKIAGWTIRTKDSTTADTARILERVRKGWQPGAIILLHDTHTALPVILEKIIEHARDTGYRFVRLDELIGEEPYQS